LLFFVQPDILNFMQTFSFPGFNSSEKEINSALNVVIAYEDLETGKRALKTYEYLVQQLGQQCLFANQMWKFEVLASPKLKEMAAKDAAGADIIIVAAHDGYELPQDVKSWVDLWLSYNTEASALVGLFDGESAETPVRSYLSAVASRAGIEFFSQPGIWPGTTEKSHTATRSTSIGEKTLAFLANATQEVPAFSHWGINE